MQTQYAPGRYITRSGLTATVGTCRVAGGEWWLVGTVNMPDTNVGVLVAWTLRGRCTTGDDGYDLIGDIDEDVLAHTPFPTA